MKKRFTFYPMGHTGVLHGKTSVFFVCDCGGEWGAPGVLTLCIMFSLVYLGDYMNNGLVNGLSVDRHKSGCYT